MTVSELKAILDGCNNDATVFVHTHDEGSIMLHDSQVWHVVGGVGESVVIIDADNTYEIPSTAGASR